MAPQLEVDAFWYSPKNLGPERQQLLVQMRAELEWRGCLVATLDDDMSLLRFLKARHWSLPKAVDMYQDMAEWRKAAQVEDLVHSFRFTERAVVKTVYPHFYHKTDKWGRPVYFELLGKVDVAKVMSVTTRERFMKYHIMLAESFRRDKLPACTVSAGRPILGMVVILDLEGFTITQFAAAKDFLMEISKLDQSVFPEHLGAMFLINCPFIFRSVWAVIKPFLDEKTLSKTKVLGTNYKEELLALIPEDHLPVRFGGCSVASETEDEGPWSSTIFSRASSRASSRAASRAASHAGSHAGVLSDEQLHQLQAQQALPAAAVLDGLQQRLSVPTPRAQSCPGGEAAEAAGGGHGSRRQSSVCMGSRRSSNESGGGCARGAVAAGGAAGAPAGLGLLLSAGVGRVGGARCEVGCTTAGCSCATIAEEPSRQQLPDGFGAAKGGSRRSSSGALACGAGEEMWARGAAGTLAVFHQTKATAADSVVTSAHVGKLRLAPASSAGDEVFHTPLHRSPSASQDDEVPQGIASVRA